MERLRALAEADPGSAGIVQRLVARVEDLAEAATRGGDVTGSLQILEIDAARVERDLIVATATRREAERGRQRQEATLIEDRVRVMNELAALKQREPALRELADRCARRIALAPRLAVPEPEALGSVPTDRAELDAFLVRVSAVTRAMDVVEQVYSAPLAELAELAGRFDAYRVMAVRTGKDADRQLVSTGQLTRSALQAVPCDLDAARTLVAQYQTLVRDKPIRSASGDPVQASPVAQASPAAETLTEGEAPAGGNRP
jgi:hypothetical protein